MSAPQHILALDLATRTGWACFNAYTGQLRSGVLRLPSTGNEIGPFLDAYDGWLGDFLFINKIDALVFEAPILTAARTHIVTARKLMSLAGITELLALKHKVAFVAEAHNATVRKHFTGKGNAKSAELKAMTMAACRARGWAPVDDNEADALAILDYFCERKGVRVAWERPLFLPMTGVKHEQAKRNKAVFVAEKEQ